MSAWEQHDARQGSENRVAQRGGCYQESNADQDDGRANEDSEQSVDQHGVLAAAERMSGSDAAWRMIRTVRGHL
eukprot:3099051-Rhodomonas_salina.1